MGTCYGKMFREIDKLSRKYEIVSTEDEEEEILIAEKQKVKTLENIEKNMEEIDKLL